MTAAVKAKPSAKSRFASAVVDLMADYDTLPDADKHAIDMAIVQSLDVSPKDWAIGMKAFVERLIK